ncbi:hypothetical protein Tco_0759808, partial [Tanacetum coccineum]
ETVVFLSALAWMDFYELVLKDDLWSNGSQNGVIVVGRVIASVVVKNSSYKGLNSKSNSCSDGSIVSVGGETFGTSFELEALATKDLKVFERRFSVIDDVI